jgi:Phospholipase B
MVEEYYYLSSSEDVTQTLLIPQGYVGSYNNPYNQSIYDVTGYTGYTYFTDPRADLMK